MIACVFPGQGSQTPGMGRTMASAYAVARETFEQADEALQRPLSTLIFEGDEADLKRTENTQPALLTTSIATWRVLKKLKPTLTPAFAAGHSLGEWSALVAVGAIAFEDAVKAVQQRGRFMQEAVPEGEGAMAAVIGLSPSEVSEICREAAKSTSVVVAPANLNSSEQIVISGASKAVADASARASAAGAKKVVPLPVSAPFHCPLMRPAADRLAEVLESIPISPLSAPVVSNVEATANRDPSRVKPLLIEQVTAPVRWEESIRFIATQGVETAIEVGPGRVLAGLIRRIDRKMKVHPSDDLDALEKTVAAIP